jgi:hypothetical protein
MKRSVSKCVGPNNLGKQQHSGVRRLPEKRGWRTILVLEIITCRLNKERDAIRNAKTRRTVLSLLPWNLHEDK